MRKSSPRRSTTALHCTVNTITFPLQRPIATRPRFCKGHLLSVARWRPHLEWPNAMMGARASRVWACSSALSTHFLKGTDSIPLRRAIPDLVPPLASRPMPCVLKRTDGRTDGKTEKRMAWSDITGRRSESFASWSCRDPRRCQSGGGVRRTQKAGSVARSEPAKSQPSLRLPRRTAN